MKPGPESFDPTVAVLRDGRTVQLRGMEPADADELVQGFERMSPDARYLRFMRSVREPNLDRLREVLASFPERGFGVVATVPAADGIDIVGSGIVLAGNPPTRGEFALSVGATHGGAGLGRAILNALIGHARRRGFVELEGFVLAENRSMLALAARVGFAVAPDPEDRSQRVCHLRLDG